MKKKQKTTSGEGSMNNLWDNRTGVASLFLLIILLPFIYSKNTLDPVIMPRLLMLGVFLAINVFLLFKIRQFLLNKWMLLSYGLYLLFVVLSVFQAVNPLESLVGIVKTSVLFPALVDVQASLIARAMIDGRSAYDEKIDGYIAAIRKDKKWLSVVQSKARQKKTTLHEELISEAKYMILREGR